MKNKLKVMLAFGTRPEAVKMAPLYYLLKECHEDFETVVCVTAQHREMLDQVLRVFNIIPDIDFNLMGSGQGLIELQSAILARMGVILLEHKPDILLVHGDTTTTLSAAMAGFYQGIDIGHIEAGLRTNNIFSPFPEEFNRQVVSKISRLHFAPTILSKENLLLERVDPSNIIITGNTVIDALFWVLNKIDTSPDKKRSICNLLDKKLPFNWRGEQFILVTGHRRESFGDGFLQICKSLKRLANEFQNVHIVYPVHLNPHVQGPVKSILSGVPNIHLVAPLDYEPFVYLLKHCYLVLTDSGGIQEEAPSLGKPVLVMRELTERPEGVDAGTVRLVGVNEDRIVTNTRELLQDEKSYRAMSRAHNPYGDGKASEKIIEALKGYKWKKNLSQ